MRSVLFFIIKISFSYRLENATFGLIFDRFKD